ncbi:MAG: hypothetical protein E7Z92_03785 [Cyanobacteria bacterium SIG31]|nr:hypothetical protein [Cyanobacteria bacterium SIG31]
MGINFENNYGKKLSATGWGMSVAKQTESNQQEVKAQPILTGRQVSADTILEQMTLSALNFKVQVPTHLNIKAAYNKAANAYEAATKALAENKDTAKAEDLEKAVEKARAEYEAAIDKMANAGLMQKTEEIQDLSTRATQIKQKTEKFYENGKLVKEVITKFENEELVQTETVLYTYDENGKLKNKEADVKDADGKRINYTATVYENDTPSQKWEKNYHYDSDGKELGYCETANSYDSKKQEWVLWSTTEKGCDKNGNPLIGKNGKELKERCTGATRDFPFYINSNLDVAIDGRTREIDKNDNIYIYDKNGNLVGKVTQNPTQITTYEFDEMGRVTFEVQRTEESGEIVNSQYEYNVAGFAVRKTTTVVDVNGKKTVTIEGFDEEGDCLKRITKEFDEKDNLSKETIEEYEKVVNADGKTILALKSDTEESTIDNKTMAELLSGLGSGVSLSGWVRGRSKDPKGAIQQAIANISGQIDGVAAKLKAVVFDTAKVDQAATTLKNYYTALLSNVYDDDNRLQRNGETCRKTFTYTDANGNVCKASSSFRHYALGLEKNANKKANRGAEAQSGIVLLENTGINHAYKITIDMRVVAQKLVEFFNQLV